MVMDRFGTDLQKKFEEGGKKFPRKLVLQLGLRLVSYVERNVKEFLHFDHVTSTIQGG